MFLVVLLLIPVVIYIVGPRPDFPAVDFKIEPTALNINQLDEYIANKESTVKNLKPDNESRIVWADSSHQKSEYAIVYLHGYSASPMEGDPVHLNFARKYGMNIYLPRLAQHGIKDKETFKDLTPKLLIDSAKEAIAIGQLLGNKIILMSCSTGSTLAVPLAAENPAMVDAHIMFSPNFALSDSKASLLTGPWGLQLAKKIQGSDYRQLNMPPICHQYWTMEYRLEGVIALQALIDISMKAEYFAKIDDPVFAAYYYKNELEQDKIISIDAINRFLNMVGTPTDAIRIEVLPNAKSHVIASSLQSMDIAGLEERLEDFAREVLGLRGAE